MLAPEITRYVDALAGAGSTIEPPTAAPSDTLVAEVEALHRGSLPRTLLDIHRTFASDRYYFPYYGCLMPLTSEPAEALKLNAWVAGSPIPPRQHVPTFSHDAYIYTVALDEAHHGEVWRFAPGPDAPETVRVCRSLDELFEHWTALATQELLSFDGTTLQLTDDDNDQLLSLWPTHNILTVPLGFPRSFLDERQRDCGMDPDSYRANLLVSQTDAMDEIDRLIAELSR